VDEERMSEANAITAGLLIEIPKRYARIRVWRNNRVKAMAIGRGGKQRMISAGVDGQADLTGICGPFGRKIEVEIKAGKDQLSEAQRSFRSMILSHGGIYVVARSVEEGIAALEEQLNEEEREAHSSDIEGRGQFRPPARARTKRTARQGQAIRPDPDYGGPAGTP
jgi:hypothetical protein